MMPDEGTSSAGVHAKPRMSGGAEAEPPFPSTRYWQIVCRSRDVRRKPRGAMLGGRAIVLFRDGEGRVAALEDRCAHRNAPLSIGRVCGGRLQCRYHGWEYDAEGRTVAVPALPDGGAIAARIAGYYTLEQDGFVWVAGGPSPPRAAPYRFPHFRERGWTSFAMRTRFRGTVEICLENFLDCPHATFVHRYWFRAPTAKLVRARVRALCDGASAEFFEEPRKRSAVWWLLAPPGGEMQHTDRFVAPATSEVEYRFPSGLQYVISSSCTDVVRGEVDVFTVISFRFRALGPVVRLYFEPLARHIIRQDVAIVAAQHDNVARFGGPRFRNTAADLLGPHIVAWRSALASGATPPAAGEPSERMIRL